MGMASSQSAPQAAMGSQNEAAGEVSSSSAQIASGNGTWRKLLAQAETVAAHVQVAAIEGDQGSGKQTLARYLHAHSRFNRLPFQCRDAREWLANVPDAGNLAGFFYLDRVDLLSPGEQDHLLELLRTMHELPRGRVALIVSSRTAFRQLTSQGMVLPDLVFRLTTVRFAIPPLKQRREDIATLAHFLLDQLTARYQRGKVALGPGALPRLLQHNWPGNVRELASVLEAAMVESRNGVIRAEDLKLASEIRARAEEPAMAMAVQRLDLHSVIRNHVQYVLDLNRGNKLRSSRQLGISRSTLYRILGDEPVLGR
jgi:DNA-binding NtrC family response regulator